MPAPRRLVGRETELAALEGLTHVLVDEGVGGCCVLAGPAGIGKTALALEAVTRAEAAGARVLRARGSELEGALSFGAVRDLLGPAVLRLPDADRDELLQGPAGFARPVLGLGAAEGDPLYGLFWLTVALAERQPLLLAVDDLHWLDLESARFCTYLAHRLEGLPILLLATAQTHHDGPFADAVGHLLDVAQVLEIAPLAPADIGELVAGQPAAEVHRLTGGNPMLAVELARNLATEPGSGLSSVTLPGVGSGILKRITGLSPAAVALARALALSPTPLALGDAAALADLDEPTAAGAADALVRADVFEWADHRLGFLHPLMRRAVYDDLEPVGRHAAHERAAAVLQDRGADAETVAAQLLASEPRGDDASVRTLVAAADLAAERRAPRAVATYLERAVAEPPAGVAELTALRHRLGRVLLDLGRDTAVDVLTAALEVAPSAPVALDLARAHLSLDQAGRASQVLAPYLVPAPRSEEELDVAAACLLAWSDLPDDHPSEAGIRADIAGTTAVQRRALVALAMYRMTRGRAGAEIRPLVARALGDLGPQSIFHLARVSLLGAVGMLEEREHIARSELERARSTGETARYAAAQLGLAIIDNQRGRLRAAEASLRLGLDAPEVEGWWRFGLESWLTTTLSMQGRFAEAAALLEETIGRDALGDSASAAVWIDQRRAELAMDRGDFAAVVEPAERAHRAGSPGFTSTACDLAIALVATGRAAEGEAVARDALSAAETLGDPQAIGLATMALGRVVGGHAGLALMRRSLDVLAATPFCWNRANTEVALGAALRAAGKRTEAKEVLASALEYAVANDAAPIERAARAELQLCGARPRRTARTGAASLTPSEERIARLAADGMSNKEIAQHLFVTVKNVEMHLVHAYRKLEVSSRRELGGVLSASSAASRR